VAQFVDASRPHGSKEVFARNDRVVAEPRRRPTFTSSSLSEGTDTVIDRYRA
jgi:hypothetical protein